MQGQITYTYFNSKFILLKQKKNSWDSTGLKNNVKKEEVLLRNDNRTNDWCVFLSGQDAAKTVQINPVMQRRFDNNENKYNMM